MIGKEVKLCGWLDEEIRQNRFLTLRDGFGNVQLVLSNQVQAKYSANS